MTYCRLFRTVFLILFLFSYSHSNSQSIKINADLSKGYDISNLKFGYNPSTGVYYQNTYESVSSDHLYFGKECKQKSNLIIDTAFTSKFAELKPQVIRFPGGEEANYFHFYNGPSIEDVDCNYSGASWNKGNGYNFEEVIFKAPLYHATNSYQYDPMFNRNYIYDFVDMVKDVEKKYGQKTEVLFVANLLQFFKHQSSFNVISECLNPNDVCFQSKLQEIVNAINFLKSHGVEVVGVELGNEMWADHKMKLGGANEVTTAKYFELCTIVSDRLKEKFDNMPMGIVVHQPVCYGADSERNKWNMDLKEFFKNSLNKEKFDALILHAYYEGFGYRKRIANPCNEYDFVNFSSDDLFSRKFILDILEDIHQIDTQKEIWYTEWNASKTQDFNLNQSLKHSIFIQNMLMSILEFNRRKGKDVVKHEIIHTVGGVGNINNATTQLIRTTPPLNIVGNVNKSSRKVEFTGSGFAVKNQLVSILSDNKNILKLESETSLFKDHFFPNKLSTDLFYLEENGKKQLLVYYANKGNDSIILDIETLVNTETGKVFEAISFFHQYIRTGDDPLAEGAVQNLSGEHLFQIKNSLDENKKIYLKDYAMGFVLIDMAENESCAHFKYSKTDCSNNYEFEPKLKPGIHIWQVSGDTLNYQDSTFTYSFSPGEYTVTHVFSGENCLTDTFETKLRIEQNLSIRSLKVVNETCGQKNGGFQFQIEGGLAPYKITFDGRDEIFGGNFYKINSMHSGEHSLIIEDQLGCIADTIIFINDTAVGSCSFVTVWDLSKKGFLQNDNISFYKDVLKGGAKYTWEEISPGNAKGKGTIPAGEGLFILAELPKNAIIRLSIRHESLKSFSINRNENSQRLIDVEQWGTTKWKTMANAFNGCSNLTISATDIPDLSWVNSMSQMFQGCTSLNSPNNINEWNTSGVTDFSGIFRNAINFNQDISNWNTESVLNMSNMFRGASSFNQDIGGWNTERVTNMSYMFHEATSFNHDISKWNTSKVINMISFLNKAESFNYNLGGLYLNASANITGMLDNSGLDCKNYSSTLKGWSQNPSTPKDRNLGAINLIYGDMGAEVRGKLVSEKGWTISGDIFSLEDCFTCQTVFNAVYLSTCYPEEAGIAIDTLKTKNNCDSIVVTTTTLLESKYVYVNEQVCDSQEEGSYLQYFTGSNGCDSVVSIVKTYSGNLETVINLTTCDPALEGIEFKKFQSAHGCDSLVMIITDLLPSQELVLEKFTCDASLEGTVIDTFINNFGCDSIVKIITSLLPSYDTTLYFSTNNRLEAGQEVLSYTKANGCDSVVTVVTVFEEIQIPYAPLDYFTNFSNGTDQYWSLHSDGKSIIETRTETKGPNKGKTNIVISTPIPESRNERPAYTIAHADLKVNFQSSVANAEIWMDYICASIDNPKKSDKLNDTIGIYYIDGNTGTTIKISDFEINKGNNTGQINLTQWAENNNVILSNKSTIRFLYRTNAIYNPQNFKSGGLHIESVNIYQSGSNSSSRLVSENLETNININAARTALFDEEPNLFNNEELVVNVYPNPVKSGERINIELSSLSEKEVFIELIDITGRRLDGLMVGTSDMVGRTIHYQTNLHVNPGNYFLNITSGNKKSIQKVVIMR